MADSIISTEPCCYICGKHSWIEEHHIFGASNRKKSERYGLKVYLCHNCHNEPPSGVHHNRQTREILQSVAQRKAMIKYGWTEQEFIEIFGKSYL